MNVHDLKTDKDAFWNTINGDKRFEIRRNDRDFAIGDVIILRETEHTGEEMNNGHQLVYTKSYAITMVTYIMYGPVYGLTEGWCIMSVDLKSYDIYSAPDHKVIPR